MTPAVRTRVAIVGAGPAGLLLSHLLDAAGIPSIVIDQRSRDEIESTIRAGILEQGTVELLDTLGDASRVRTVGHRHDGIELRFAGEGHRIDFPSLVGRSVWLYPQHEVLKDLIAARLAAGQDLRFGVTAENVVDAETDRPRVIARDAEGQPFEIEAEFVVGSDGSRSVARAAVTGSSTGGYFDVRPLETYPERALRRIWKAQHFSWWMTSLLHVAPDATDFDRRRQLGELRGVVESRHGQAYLAEAYCGWPLTGG
ncbi:FAD-dependent monooxygenase [Microbacterium enclense]|uniref:FAD-dependent monooxygenase n=1 Tax=Microbacterium enclense TaxID=993073 RepID=UPI003D71B87D